MITEPKTTRKLNRLKGFNYSQSGYYFITVCTQNRLECFGNIDDGVNILNEFGNIVNNQWLWLSEQYSYIKLDEFIIMPNHVHGIVLIENDDHGRDNPRIVPTTTTNIYHRRHNLLSKTINAFKTTSSKMLHQNGLNEFKWQRSFYDHIIRNEKSLIHIREYIINNPLNWDLDSENQRNQKNV